MVFPKPKGRRTHGAYRTLDAAKAGGHQLLRMLNGAPIGYHVAIFERLGAFVLLSYPTDQRP